MGHLSPSEERFDKKELSSLKDHTGLPIDVFCIARSGGSNLQDAVLIKSTPKRLARPNSLSGKLRTVALRAFSSIENMGVGAVGAFAYIPSVYSTTAPDSIIVANTGDANAILFRVESHDSKTQVSAHLLTQNRYKSFYFFSAQNLTPRSNNSEIDQPTIGEHVLNRASLQDGSRLFLGLFTDGALPLIDEIHEINSSMETNEIEKIKEKRRQIEQYARGIVEEWGEENGISLMDAEQRLSKQFIESARERGVDDCSTAMLIDVTQAPAEQGVITGVIDGHRSPGSGKYARELALKTHEVFAALG